jgi:hypothetical protein
MPGFGLHSWSLLPRLDSTGLPDATARENEAKKQQAKLQREIAKREDRVQRKRLQADEARLPSQSDVTLPDDLRPHSRISESS